MLQHDPILHCDRPMCTLVFHYDQNPNTLCESSMLTTSISKAAPVQRLVVLVSASNYFKRKQFYRDNPNTVVLPLLFGFEQLGAKELKQVL